MDENPILQLTCHQIVCWWMVRSLQFIAIVVEMDCNVKHPSTHAHFEIGHKNLFNI
jgi:hypothetical protein